MINDKNIEIRILSKNLNIVATKYQLSIYIIDIILNHMQIITAMIIYAYILGTKFQYFILDYPHPEIN